MIAAVDSPYPSIQNACDLTAAVTCYNEQDLVIETLETLMASLRGFDFTWEIVVIDDASTDASAERIKAFAAAHPDVPLRLYVNDVNQGFGSSIVDGAYLGLGTWYRVCCGDGGEPRETFDAIFSQIGRADVIVPWIDGDGGRSFFRRLLSAMYTGLINFITGHRLRYYNGLYLARRTDFMRYSGNYRGFGAQADILARMLSEGRSFLEVPITCDERKHGASQALKLKNILSVALTVLDMTLGRFGQLLYPQRKSPRLVPQILMATTPVAARLVPSSPQSASGPDHSDPVLRHE